MSRQQLRERELQRNSEPKEDEVRRIRLSQLDSSQMVDMDIGQLRQLLLRQRALIPKVANALAELAKKFSSDILPMR